MKHTPGPWLITLNQKWGFRVDPFQRSQFFIEQVASDDESHANMLLVRETPEIFEIMKQMRGRATGGLQRRIDEIVKRVEQL